jgi:hypothetical protein
MTESHLFGWGAVLCFFGTALLCAAHLPAPGEEIHTVQVTIKQADLKNNPEQITKKITKGDRLEVRLEMKATGYTWKQTKESPAKLKREGDPKIERAENAPGAPEFKVFRFDVLDAGELEFQLVRPFGKSEPKVLELKIELPK